MSAEPARCPLGFTGTPPPGHPSVPGAGSSTDSPKGGHGGSPLAFVTNLASQPWSQTHTLLLLDALFIVGATLVAIYWDRIPLLKNLKAGRSGAASAAAAGKPAGSS